jgi:hypothetical protein
MRERATSWGCAKNEGERDLNLVDCHVSIRRVSAVDGRGTHSSINCKRANRAQTGM